MKTVRPIAAVLHLLCKIAGILIILTVVYSLVALLIYSGDPSANSMMTVTSDGVFTIFYPFTKSPFLLGDYTTGYLVTYLTTVTFYGIFLLLLSGVFHAFRQIKLFTSKGVKQLSAFYILNLIVPFILLGLFMVMKEDASDFVKIIFLHLVIGVFAFFMAAIFRQGLFLQEEQDLTF